MRKSRLSQPLTTRRKENLISGFDAYYLFFSLFIACIVIAQFLATKLCMVEVKTYKLIFPGGVLAYALTYFCTDVISEVWGKARAAAVIFYGFIANIAILVLIRISLAVPANPGWELLDSFNSIAHAITRVTLASIAAYLISQYHDVWMYHLLKRLTRDKLLWLRNIVSTTISQFLDTVVFIGLAFWGALDLKTIGSIIIGQFIVKFAIAVVDTPFVYAAVWFLGSKRKR